jgi:predicted MFS family arabinose efflux permease
MHIPSASSGPTQPEQATLKSWLAVFSVSLGAFVLVTSEFLPIGLLTNISGALGVSDGVAGLMVSVPGIVAAIAAPALTVLASRVDRRVLLLSLMVLLAVSSFISAFAPDFKVMLVARVLFGISLGGFWSNAIALGGRLVPKASMVRATTIIMAGISIATVAGVPVSKVVADFLGWRTAFSVIGGVVLAAGAVQWWALPNLPAPKAPGFLQFTQLLRHPDARLGLVTVALVIAGHFGAYTYVTPFLKQNPQMGAGYISSLLLAFGAAGIAGNFIGGAAAGRNLRGTIGTVITLLAASIVLLPYTGMNVAATSALILCWGLAFGAVPIVLQLWVFKAAPEAMEGGAALLTSTFQVFIALGSVLGGQVVDQLGVPAVMWCGGGVSALAIIVVLMSRHQPGVKGAESAQTCRH